MSDVVLDIPDALAKEAKAAGLLKPNFIASLLCAEIRRRRVNKMFSAADRLADLDQPLSESEIAAEIASGRSDRRTA